jgi:hypothetical protein
MQAIAIDDPVILGAWRRIAFVTRPSEDFVGKAAGRKSPEA